MGDKVSYHSEYLQMLQYQSHLKENHSCCIESRSRTGYYSYILSLFVCVQVLIILPQAQLVVEMLQCLHQQQVPVLCLLLARYLLLHPTLSGVYPEVWTTLIYEIAV